MGYIISCPFLIKSKVYCSPHLALRLTSAKQCALVQLARGSPTGALAPLADVGIQIADPSHQRTIDVVKPRQEHTTKNGATSQLDVKSARNAGSIPIQWHGTALARSAFLFHSTLMLGCRRRSTAQQTQGQHAQQQQQDKDGARTWHNKKSIGTPQNKRNASWISNVASKELSCASKCSRKTSRISTPNTNK